MLFGNCRKGTGPPYGKFVRGGRLLVLAMLNSGQTGDEIAVNKAPEDRTVSELNLPKIISFNSLVRCGDEVWIENDGQIYRLRRTKQGKLVLTK